MNKNTEKLTKIDQALIDLALSEDLGVPAVDATCEGLLGDAEIPYRMSVISKENGPLIVAGQALVEAIYAKVEPDAILTWAVEDGAVLVKGETLFTVSGSAKGLLIAERTALNFLQRLCAVATHTAAFVDLVKGTSLKILDTRKTTPGMRHLEKYAVHCGGGTNHRMGLYDAIMIKDNHVDLLGGMENTLNRLENPNQLPVIVEVRTVEECKIVLDKGRDVVTRLLLDNMSLTELSTCVSLCADKVETEASGGLHLGNILDVANTGVDYASIGALTHSAGSADLSMKALL